MTHTEAMRTWIEGVGIGTAATAAIWATAVTGWRVRTKNLYR